MHEHQHLNCSPEEASFPSLGRSVAVCWMLLIFAACCYPRQDDELLRFPFVWRDVAVVHLLSLLPFTLILASVSRRNLGLVMQVFTADFHNPEIRDTFEWQLR